MVILIKTEQISGNLGILGKFIVLWFVYAVFVIKRPKTYANKISTWAVGG